MNLEELSKMVQELKSQIDVMRSQEEENSSVYFEYTRAYFEKTRGKWRSVWKVKNKHIGYFETKEEAVDSAIYHNKIAKHLLDE